MKKKLGEIAAIRMGYQFRGRIEPCDNANVSLIQIKDIDDQQAIHCDQLTRVKLENPEPHLVDEGDILFLSRGPKLRATLIERLSEDTVATSYFFVLRPKPKYVVPAYLAWAMNQPEFQDALTPLLSGSSLQLIPKRDFQDLTISIPSLQVQNCIGKLHSLHKQELELTALLQQKRQMLLRAVSNKLNNGHLAFQGT